MKFKWYLLLLLSFAAVAPANAHQLSTSFVNANLETGETELKLPFRELGSAIQIDLDGDGNLTWGEIKNSKNEIQDFVASRITWSNQGAGCSAEFQGPLMVEKIEGANYLVLNALTSCEQSTANQIKYDLFFEQNHDHKALVNLMISGASYSHVLDDDKRFISLDVSEQSGIQSFLNYVVEGVWHIWIGFDHILFLMVLLVSVVLTHRNGRWTPEDSYRGILLKSFLIISSFTIAHSITLSLGVMNVLSFNSQWVEFGIALSIILAALNNIWPLISRVYWATFALGLIHGLGFASVLSNLTQSRATEVLTLAGFNIGVELGQLVIVLVALPLIFLMSRAKWYSEYGMQGFSLLAGALGTYWAIVRIA